MAGEDALVHGSGVFLLAQDHARTWAAQGLVGSGGYELRVRNWRRMRSSSDQSGKMRHVDQQQRAGFVHDLAHAGKIEEAGISAATADDQLWFFPQRCLFKLVVIDGLRVFADAIRHDAIQLSRK